MWGEYYRLINTNEIKVARDQVTDLRLSEKIENIKQKCQIKIDFRACMPKI